MENMEILEQLQSELSQVKRWIKKGELVIKGENKDVVTHDTMDILSKYGVKYEVNEFQKINVITF